MSERSLYFECARPNREDARLVMEWRNDPTTLQMSFHRTPKEEKAFYEEFRSSYFSSHHLPPLFVKEGDARVAFIRFRPAVNPVNRGAPTTEISINVAPDRRGEGIGTAALQEIQEWVRQAGVQEILAEIKKENLASQKSFSRAGYKKIGEKRKRNDETGEEEEIFVYLLSLTPIRAPLFDRVFIVAEAGSNWRAGSPSEDLIRAKKLIDAAVLAGADAVKFQTYRPETVYVKNAGASGYLKESGIDKEIGALFADLAMPYEMIGALADYCRASSIQFMSTPFGEADFLAVDPFVTLHKIASYEIGHKPLITLAAKSGKPLILSTGAATEEEIAWAVKTFKEEGGKQLVLLQCTAQYPAASSAMNLLSIPWLRKRFSLEVGLSDHSRDPLVAPISAVALGAKVIEKHFTLDNRLPGPDHFFALTPPELKKMVEAIREAEKMRGVFGKEVLAEEEELRAFACRGIQALEHIRPGEPFVEGVNIAILRPGNQKRGLHPRYLEEIKGKKATRAIAAGSGIMKGDWEC